MENRGPPSYVSDRNRTIVERTEAETSIPAVRSRTQAMHSISFLQRHRLRRRQDEETSLTESLHTVQEAVDRLNEASNNLSSLLDEPIPRITTPDILTSEYSGEAEVNRRRSKRRKVDSEKMTSAIKYGYRGQVVPGPLQMKILSCDGGYISGPTVGRAIRNYWPENILQNDKSVYCTETSECNLIYQHVGGTPFCLKKVVVKAPRAGFDAPIQEGMIFVSMNSGELLTRTSHYRLRETTPPTLPSSRNATEPYRDTTAYRDAANLPWELGVSRPPSRRAAFPPAQVIVNLPQNTSGVIRHPQVDNHEAGNANFQDPQHPVFPLIDLGDDSTLPPRTDTPTVGSLFNVEISCDDLSGDEEEESSAGVLADLADRCRREYPLTSSEDEDDEEEGPSRALRRRIQLLRAVPRKIEWNATEAAINDSRTVKSQPTQLQPHAKFFIESNAGTISMKFDPPISGRYILFKLWTPAEGQNIDIQSIICYGFAGPRFFPSIDLR